MFFNKLVSTAELDRADLSTSESSASCKPARLQAATESSVENLDSSFEGGSAVAAAAALPAKSVNKRRGMSETPEVQRKTKKLLIALDKRVKKLEKH